MKQALQHSKVKLTWDEDDQQRKQIAKKAFSQRDIEDNELKAYLASSDSESEDYERESKKEKYRSLLGGLTFGGKGKSEPTGEVEVTFTSGLNEDDKGKPVIELQETTIEAYARKEKERRKARKEKMKAGRAGEDGAAEKPAAAPAAEAEPDQAAVDLGFNDPFFDEPEQSNAALKKAQKQKRREEKEKEAAEKATKRAELELLMEEDVLGPDGRKLSHFDMKQIVKADKMKKVKKAKHRKPLKETEGLQEDFQMDVKDPRFKAVFERHAFAIDPTNPRFVKTDGTKQLMEEKRKRVASNSATTDAAGAPPDEDGRERKRKKTAKPVAKKDELQSLVRSLKKKAKQA